VDKGIEDKALIAMLEEAHGKFLKGDAYIQAKSIKVYGDTAIHRRQEIDQHLIGTTIYVLVEMLNELFYPVGNT